MTLTIHSISPSIAGGKPVALQVVVYQDMPADPTIAAIHAADAHARIKPSDPRWGQVVGALAKMGATVS